MAWNKENSSLRELTPPLPDPRELTETSRQEICDQALLQAERLRRQKRYQEGVDLLLEALKYGSEKPMIYFRLGNLFFDRGDLSRAEYSYRRATEEDPNYASAYHNLGVVYRRQGHVGQSVRCLKKAHRLELRKPRAANPTDRLEQKRKRPLLLRVLPFAAIGFVLLAVYLVTRLA